MLEIIHVASGIKQPVTITLAESQDFRKLTVRRYSFLWRLFRHSTAVYLLRLEGTDNTLGAISLVDVAGEKRIEIKLLASAKENIGAQKAYDGIAGCLIAFTCRFAVDKYGPEACVSLVPKTELATHYMKKYGMLPAGRQLCLEGNALLQLMKDYSI